MGYVLFGQVSIPYTQNFDTFPVDNVNFGPGAEPFPLPMGWVNVQAGDDAQDWYGRSTATGSSSTGPTADHTSGTGTYMFIEDGFGTFTNIQLESPTVDLLNVSGNVELSYWAHSQTTAAAGNAMAVDVFSGGIWTQVDSFGILSTTDTWFNRTVDLTPYTGDTIKIRWRGSNNVTSFQHDIAIDDVEIYPTSLTAIIGNPSDPTCNGFTDGSLTASAIFGVPPYTYLWSTGDTAQTINVGAGTYCVVVTDTVGDTSSTCFTVNQPSAIDFSLGVSLQEVCAGDSNAMLSIDSASGGVQLAACGLSTAACVGPEDTVQVGFGTTNNLNTVYPAPFGNWYWGARQQIIFRASELQAAGIQPGLLKGLGWDVDTLTGGATTSYANYEIRLGCTSDSVLTAASWVNVPDVVYPADSVFITPGWNYFEFPVAYQWDGVSNLVVEWCSNNGSFSRNAESPYTPTSYVSCHYYRADNSTVCGNNSNSGTSSNRPNIRFVNCSAPVVPYSVNWSTGATTPDIMVGAGTYSVVITDANGCTAADTTTITEATPVTLADEGICDGGSATLDAGVFSTYNWSTGDSTSSISVTSASATYAVTVVDANGCVSTDSATVTTLANPAPSIGPDVVACEDATPVMLDAGAGFATYSWDNGDVTQMTSVSMAGDYSVMVADSNGCMGSDTVNVSINPSPVVDLGGDSTVCQFDLPLTLTAPTGTNYLWQDGSMNQTFNIDTTAQGQGPISYSVAVTDINGCVGTDTVVITVDICPGIIGPNALITQVYPNPTQQMLNVKVADVNPTALSIRVVDLNGRIVFEQSEDNHNGNVLLQLDLGQLAKGMYYLHLDNDNRNSVHRITIQ